jgi:hypothetical protein
MEHPTDFAQISVAGTLYARSREPEPVRIPLQPRNTMMDALVKHAATSEEFAFEAVCKAVGGAFKKATA